MKKLMGLAMLAGATMAGAGAAHAEGTWSGNIAMTTDYVFRGISLSDGDYAVQGGVDYVDGMFYAGAWGSSLSSGGELDLYAGFTPTLGPVALNLGAIYYTYPGASDDTAEYDYFELKAAGSISATEALTLGAAVYYSPENYGDTGDALYLEVNGALALSDAVSISAAYGSQTIEEPAAGLDEDDYATWNLGVGYSFAGFGFDLRYHDTDIDAADDIAGYTLNATDYDSSYVFTVKRAL